MGNKTHSLCLNHYQVMLMVFAGIHPPGYVEDKCCITVESKTRKDSVPVLLISVLSPNGVNNQIWDY